MIKYEEFLTGIMQAAADDPDDPDITEKEREMLRKTLEKVKPYITAINAKADELQLSPEEEYILHYLTEHSDFTRNPETEIDNYTEDREARPGKHKVNAYDITLMQIVSMSFVHNHKEEAQALFDQGNRRRLVESMKKEDWEMVKATPDGIKKLTETKNPTLDDILEIIGFGNAVHLYSHLDAEKVFSTTGKRVKSVEYPIDKVNNNVWNLLSVDTAGQLTFNLDMASYQDRQKGKQVPLYYSINFSAITDITITKQLTPYDKRVYIAIAALYNQGNTVISYSQIYAAMGNKKRPSAKDIDKIDKSVTKMAAAWLTMDNGGEIKAKYKYKPWKYDAALLPIERMRSVINGVPVENAIHLFREPPLVTFAKERKQLTTFDILVLDTPVSKTDQNIMIEDYLLDAIAAIGHGRRNSKILFNTIYEAAKVDTKKQKQRAPEKIVKVLEYYVTCGLIKKFVMENDGVNITV